MTLEGASWGGSSICLANEISTTLPPVKFTWKHKIEQSKTDSNNNHNNDKITLPVYLNETRAEFLFSVDLNSPPDISLYTWYQRGAALNVWKPNI